MTKDEALRLALEALEAHADIGIKSDKAITAIKAALEAKDEPWEKFCDSNCVWTDHHPDCKLAKDEPVALAWAEGYRMGISDERTSEANIGIAGFNAKVEPVRENPYVTTPPQRTWEELTDEERGECINANFGTGLWFMAKDIEAKLKEKNT